MEAFLEGLVDQEASEPCAGQGDLPGCLRSTIDNYNHHLCGFPYKTLQRYYREPTRKMVLVVNDRLLLSCSAAYELYESSCNCLIWTWLKMLVSRFMAVVSLGFCFHVTMRIIKNHISCYCRPRGITDGG